MTDTLTQRVAFERVFISTRLRPFTDMFTFFDGRYVHPDTHACYLLWQASGAQHLQGLVEALKAQTDIIKQIEMGLTPESLTVAKFGEVRKLRIRGEEALAALPPEFRGEK